MKNTPRKGRVLYQISVLAPIFISHIDKHQFQQPTVDLFPPFSGISRYIVFDQEHGTRCNYAEISAIKFEEISCIVVIIIPDKAEAELSSAESINIRERVSLYVCTKPFTLAMAKSAVCQHIRWLQPESPGLQA